MDLSIQDLKAQINFYNFFSTFFREKPSTEWLKSALELVRSWGDTNSPLHQQLIENVQKSGLDHYLNSLTQEYERLFFAPGHVPVNLYESVYSGSGLLMQETTINVRQHYLRAGLVVKSLYSIPDDHIATELEFMRFLSQRILELVQYDGAEEDIKEMMVYRSEFISEHLQQWITTLAETIRANSTEPFFGLMSIGLESLVEDNVTN
ncbi:Chaperone protein TorD [Desulfosporosinus sp. I2]|uniref:TorD/DmsD family molecular chaperone n=1 Tax=Desulfosporosinus sp. I2 TaxID=1617025 RepID=UPI0005ED4C89|nr:molecular chaperone TorD family protein [Desulfosporosinus sp. I2]KJR46402.1 Chaperone protein TorD [Desulfosporosinus sp. I2]